MRKQAEQLVSEPRAGLVAPDRGRILLAGGHTLSAYACVAIVMAHEVRSGDTHRLHENTVGCFEGRISHAMTRSIGRIIFAFVVVCMNLFCMTTE
jgi:hypothetical protein